MTERKTGPEGALYEALLDRGISRRAFLRFSALMAATLALPASYAPEIARAVAAAPRLPLIWLRGQDCGGNTTALLRSTTPPVADLLLELLSVEYHESLMAPAGAAAQDSLTSTMAAYPDGYIAVVEGAVPTAEDGAFCLIGGRPFRDIVREVCDGALATIAVGTCAFDGGAPGAGGGPSGAVGAGSVVSGTTLVNLPGCPVNVENLSATIVHYLTRNEWPPTDGMGRPYFAYGSLIHNQCERRPHYEYGEFALEWGDEGAQKGWCLYKLGCKGPETFANCPTIKYADGTSWPVQAGHGCIGCHMPDFWDAMSPFYRRLPPPVGFVPGLTVDHYGGLLVAGVVAGTAAHGAASYVRERRWKAAERKAAERGTGGRLEAPEAPEAIVSPASEASAQASEGVMPALLTDEAPEAPMPEAPTPESPTPESPTPESPPPASSTTETPRSMDADPGSEVDR